MYVYSTTEKRERENISLPEIHQEKKNFFPSSWKVKRSLAEAKKKRVQIRNSNKFAPEGLGKAKQMHGGKNEALALPEPYRNKFCSLAGEYRRSRCYRRRLFFPDRLLFCKEAEIREKKEFQ